MTQSFEFRGACPSKKNMYEISKRRNGAWGLRVNERAVSLLTPLGFQMNAAWRGQPLIHPEMTLKFWASTSKIDRDGMTTSVLDLLQPKWIVNDNIENFNGRLVIEPAELCGVGEERVLIVVSDRKQEEKAA